MTTQESDDLAATRTGSSEGAEEGTTAIPFSDDFASGESEKSSPLADFFRLLFGEQEGYGCLAGKKGGQVQHHYFAYPDELRDHAPIVDRDGIDTYFCVSLLKERGPRTKDNAIATSHVIRVDLDECDSDALLVEPSIVLITSPGRYQAFWILAEPIPTPDAQQLSRRINEHHKGAGADSCWSADHLFRLPGTLNYKYNPPYRVEIAVYDLTYRPEDFDAYPEVEPSTAGSTKPSDDLPDFLPLPYPDESPQSKYFYAFFDRVKDEEPQPRHEDKAKSRSGRTYWFMCRCAEMGLSPGQIRTATYQYAPALHKEYESAGFIDADFGRFLRDDWPALKDVKFNRAVEERAFTRRVDAAAKVLVDAERDAASFDPPPPPELSFTLLEDLNEDNGPQGQLYTT